MRNRGVFVIRGRLLPKTPSPPRNLGQTTVSRIACGFNAYSRPHVVQRDVTDAKKPTTNMRKRVSAAHAYPPWLRLRIPQAQNRRQMDSILFSTVITQSAEPTRLLSCTKAKRLHGCSAYVINA